jgi:putative DNA primase/helicase
MGTLHAEPPPIKRHHARWKANGQRQPHSDIESQTAHSNGERNTKRDGPSPARGIIAALDARKHAVVAYLLPNAVKKGHEYEVGSLAGEPGHSLKVHANGKGSVWCDFATDDSGADLLDLWKDVRCGGDIKRAMQEAAEWLGMAGNDPRKPAAKVKVASPEKEHEVARWTLYDAEGNPWIQEVRYETDKGKKSFRHFDLKNNRRLFFDEYKIPSPHPIFNLHLLKDANEIVFVEGAKCVAALSILGYAVTTTLHGATNADKSDYSPLAGKTVTVWADNDLVGAKYADTVAKMVLSVGGKVRRVEIPPGKPGGWDIADAIEEGWTVDGVDTMTL